MQVFGKARDIRDRLVEEKEMELLPKLLKKGDHVWDIGANFAYYSVRLSEAVGPTGRVDAFEPIPFTYKVCKKLLEKFNTRNVHLHEKGVGSKTEQVEFSVPVQDFGALSTGQAHFADRKNDMEGHEKYYGFDKAKTFMCDVVDLDTYLDEPSGPLSFVKIDIEGAEYHALQGMRKHLEKHKPAMLVEIQPFFLEGFGIKEKDLLNLIDDMGYDIFLYEQEKAGLRAYTEDLFDSNYILLHRDRLSEYTNLMQK